MARYVGDLFHCFYDLSYDQAVEQGVSCEVEQMSLRKESEDVKPMKTQEPLELGSLEAPLTRDALGRWRRSVLKSDCTACDGLCCVALHFKASDGFPVDKPSGKPCPHLMLDFRCAVHGTLAARGFKGCLGFDCLGAGQRISALTFAERSWQTAPASASLIFKSFVVMMSLYELLWYLSEALEYSEYKASGEHLEALLREVEPLTFLSHKALGAIDLHTLRTRANLLLTEVGEQVRGHYGHGALAPAKIRKRLARGADFAGWDLSSMSLRGANFRSAELIAANLSHSDLSGAELIGADLRDANLSDANLKDALYLTQAQVNKAKGDLRTRLPEILERPAHWRT